jgi:hypothetical protein
VFVSFAILAVIFEPAVTMLFPTVPVKSGASKHTSPATALSVIPAVIAALNVKTLAAERSR